MRFLVDECTGPLVANWLRQEQHDVFAVYDQARGAEGDAILQRACAEDRILVTCDKDFGELVFREKRLHRGVILLRLENPNPVNRIAALQRLLAAYADQLAGSF